MASRCWWSSSLGRRPSFGRLMAAPRPSLAWVRRMIWMPSISERVHLSHPHYQHVLGRQRVDGFAELGPVADDFAALFFPVDLATAFRAQRSNLPIEILIERARPRITNFEHFLSFVSRRFLVHQKARNLGPFAQVAEGRIVSQPGRQVSRRRLNPHTEPNAAEHRWPVGSAAGHSR